MQRRKFLKHSLSAAVLRLAPAGALALDTRRTATSAAEPAAKQELSEHARKVHQDAIVIVMHDHNPIGPDLKLMLDGGVTAKVYQIVVDVEPTADFRASASQRSGWSKHALAAIEGVNRVVSAQPERLLLARSADDILRAKREHKVAILLGAEGGKLLEGKIELLARFHELGLRELQLRWAVPNQLVEQNSLTPFGAQVVRECQKLGIIIDLTHIPSRAYFEVVELTSRPAIVSHGLAGAGDVDDRRMKALAGQGGVLGIHFYSSYLGPRPTVDRVVEQVDYIANLVGIDAAGLGVDFFPTDGGWRDFQRAQGTQDISWAVSDICQISRVTDALLARNYSEPDVGKILGGNFLALCRKVFGS